MRIPNHQLSTDTKLKCVSMSWSSIRLFCSSKCSMWHTWKSIIHQTTKLG